MCGCVVWCVRRAALRQVEHVISGSRLRLLVPKENCLVTLALAAVRAPSAARPGSPVR